MHDVRVWVNSAGLFVTMVGVYVVYVNSPLNYSVTDGGSADTDFQEIERTTERRNRLLRVGVVAILLGSLIQLLSNFLPANHPVCGHALPPGPHAA